MIKILPHQLDRREEFALYIHIPFCHYRCHYCDFYTSVGVPSVTRNQVVARIIYEVKEQLAYLEITKLDSVYFGGGTPSLMQTSELAEIIELVQSYKPRQVTIEMNPEDITPELLVASGLDLYPNIRLSLGMQTFHQESLKAVGRMVSVEQMEQALTLLEPYKERISLDLIAGLPEHTLEIVLADMQRLLDYRPSHISLYSLAMEEGTILTYKGHKALPKEDIRSKQWAASRALLLSAGYHQYEVSNYTLDASYESLQNKHYWQLKPYIGIGPGAVGNLVLLDGTALRVTGKKAFKPWQDTSHDDIWDYEAVSAKDFLFEHYMMGLRMEDGISKRILKDRFGDTGLAPWIAMKELSNWQPYMQESEGIITLSSEGRLYLDAFLVELMEWMDEREVDRELAKK